MKNTVIAIDGPAGAGKSSVSKCVAKKFGFVYIDTGAMYRAVAVYFLRLGSDTEKLISKLSEIDIDLFYSDDGLHVTLNNEDVTGIIRTSEVSAAASAVAVLPEVRLKLVELQRKIAAGKSGIMDGRDIGTYVLPDADLKIYLTASSDERAKRRCLEYKEQNIPYDFQKVKADIENRDYNDMHREFAPLRRAEDAILVDTDNLNFEQVTEKISEIIKEKCNVLR